MGVWGSGTAHFLQERALFSPLIALEAGGGAGGGAGSEDTRAFSQNEKLEGGG